MRRKLGRFGDGQFPRLSGFHDDFDIKFNRTFNRTFKLAFVGIIGGWLVSLGVLGFIGWVIYKLLQHNGVI